MATYLEERKPVTTVNREPHPDTGIAARYVNIIVGAWLFISAFLWPHTAPLRTNTWIVGVLAVIFAAVALRTPWVRYVNTALSIWLFISTLSMSHLARGTLWNNIIVAIVMFIVSLIPSQPISPGQRPRRYAGV